jgi:EpsI family protein
MGLVYIWQARGIKPNDIDLSSIPLEVGDWKGKDIGISKRDMEILETDDVLMREYENSAGYKVYLLIVYSGNNRDAFHPPELCYLGEGTALLDKSSQVFEIGDKGATINANKLFMKDKYGKELAWYWFTIGSRVVSSFYEQQVSYTMDELRGVKTGGSLVRVSTRVTGDDVKKSEDYSKDFIKKIAPIITEHMS